MVFSYDDMVKRGLKAGEAERLLESVQKLDLEKFYKNRGLDQISAKDKDEISKIVNEPFAIRYNDSKQEFEYLNDDSAWLKIPVDYSKNFTDSNRWVSSVLPDHTSVFKNCTLESISDEQESFYIAIVLAGVYGKSFSEYFFDLHRKYDYDTWRAPNKEESWSKFVGEIVELGSFNVKMLVSACRHKTQSEKNDIFSYANIGLPEATVLELDKLKNDVKRIRMKFEENELSAASKKDKSRLEIKVLNKKLEDQILSRQLENPDLYQLWCVFKINSENVEANVKLELKKAARKNFDECVQNSDLISNAERDLPTFRDVYIEYAYRELMRAFITKLRTREVKEYLRCVEEKVSYSAPKRV